jgi:hypothetical protein
MVEDPNKVAMLDLEASLDDIEDLPVFATFPTGAYRVRLVAGLERKLIADKSAVEAAMTLLEVIELPKDSLEEDPITKEMETAPKPGDVGSVAYMLENKFGLGKYKADWLLPISRALNTKVIGEIEVGSKGLEFMVVIKRTVDKKDDSKRHMRLQAVAIL